MNKKVLVVLLLVPLVASITVNSATAALPPQDTAGGPRDYRSDHPRTQLAAADVLEYWTEERMAAAQAPSLDLTAGSGPAIQRLAQADGPAMAAYGINFGGTETAAFPLNMPGAGSGPTPAFNYPFAFNYSYVQMAYVNALIPYSTFGKLFYTRLGTDYTCSGTSVTSGDGGNSSLILTAAHCLHDGDNDPASWSYNILFVPGKLGVSEPFGSWTAVPDGNLWVTNSYYTTGNVREDFGFIVTDQTSNACGELAPCIGAQGLAWNQSPIYDFWAYGYPVAAPFTGDRLIMCSATLSILDPLEVTGTGPLPMGIGCNMTAGSSGGAWIIFGKTANVGYANSVVSYKYTQPSQPNAVYGPYFASNFSTLWESARLDTP